MSIALLTDRICKRRGKHTWALPWWKGNRICLLCGRHEGITVGENSIQLSPGGTDVLKWSASGVPTAVGDLGMDTTTGLPQCYTDGAATALSTSAGSGDLILVEKEIVEADAQSYDFSSLDGDSDYVYFMTYHFVNGNASTAADFYIRPNGANTNCSSTKIQRYNASSIATTSNASEIHLCNSPVGDFTWGSFYFFANSTEESQGFERFLVSHLSNDYSSGAGGYLTVGAWADNSTNLTSIRVYSSVSDGLGQGSEMVLYKLAQS